MQMTRHKLPAAVLCGMMTGLGEGSERALISLHADERERGTAFGWYHLAVDISAIRAGALSLLSVLLLLFWSFRNLPIGGR